MKPPYTSNEIDLMRQIDEEVEMMSEKFEALLNKSQGNDADQSIFQASQILKNMKLRLKDKFNIITHAAKR